MAASTSPADLPLHKCYLCRQLLTRDEEDRGLTQSHGLLFYLCTSCTEKDWRRALPYRGMREIKKMLDNQEERYK